MPQPMPATAAAAKACGEGRVWRGSSTWRWHSRRTQRSCSSSLTRSQLVSQSMQYEEMLSWQLFFTSLLDLDKTSVQDVLDPTPYRATPDLPIDELLPALSTGLHHDALIVDADGKLAGMITQTDLLAALWRSHVAEQVASVGPPV